MITCKHHFEDSRNSDKNSRLVGNEFFSGITWWIFALSLSFFNLQNSLSTIWIFIIIVDNLDFYLALKTFKLNQVLISAWIILRNFCNDLRKISNVFFKSI